MKYSLDLSHHRRANVWLDEAPLADFTALSVVTRVVTPRHAVNVQRRIAAIEFYSSNDSYALPGAELVDSNVNGLEIVVPVNPAGAHFPMSLASVVDEVLLGMPDEYTVAVFKGVERAAESVGLPTNASLTFRWAAHGLICSSRSVFDRVSNILVRLLMVPAGVGKETIIALFD